MTRRDATRRDATRRRHRKLVSGSTVNANSALITVQRRYEKRTRRQQRTPRYAGWTRWASTPEPIRNAREFYLAKAAAVTAQVRLTLYESLIRLTWWLRDLPSRDHCFRRDGMTELE